MDRYKFTLGVGLTGEFRKKVATVEKLFGHSQEDWDKFTDIEKARALDSAYREWVRVVSYGGWVKEGPV